MSVCYVIASWAGHQGAISRDKLTMQPEPKDYVSEHLKVLTDIPHHLDHVILMKAECTKDDNPYPGFYDNIEEYTSKLKCTFEEIDCPNVGVSYGQYFRAYEKYRTEFDYYIFMEEDYVPTMDHFDSVLINLYEDLFSEDIGHLTCWFIDLYNMEHAAFSLGVVS